MNYLTKSIPRFNLVLLPLLLLPLSNHSLSQDISYQTYVYKTVDGLEIHADVYQSADKHIRPAILYFHGGALIFGSRKWIDSIQLKHYIDAGFNLVSVDYRLAPQVTATEIYSDIKDAYIWLIENSENLLIDKNRIALVGHSAGAYLALLGGTRFQPRPTAIVSFYGYGDITGEWYLTPSQFYLQQPSVSRQSADNIIGNFAISEDITAVRLPFYIYTRQQGLWPALVVGKNPALEPDIFRALSPVYNIDSQYPPTLLLHGDADTDVPYSESVSLDRELEKYSVRHKLITLKGRDHLFDRDMSNPEVATAFSEVLAFLHNEIGP